jgi:hypothetical protein
MAGQAPALSPGERGEQPALTVCSEAFSAVGGLRVVGANQVRSSVFRAQRAGRAFLNRSRLFLGQTFLEL